MEMSTTDEQRQSLQNQLKSKLICRFCLSQQSKKLGNIYMRDQRIKCTAPLTVQVMACSSMEIFANDGLPQSVCFECRVLFEHSYRFKQMCKKAETLLRQVPLTGEWPPELPKPTLPSNLIAKPARVEICNMDVSMLSDEVEHVVQEEKTSPVKTLVSPSVRQKEKSVNGKRQVANETLNGNVSQVQVEPKMAIMPRKILNANPAKSPEPPVPKRAKKEKTELVEEKDVDEDDAATIFLNKVENDEELSIEDLHRLIQSNTAEDITHKIKEKPAARPKLLNKASIRILNKEANKLNEPQFSKPEVKTDKDGNVAVVTEIIDPSEFNNDKQNIKDALPVETNVFPCPHCDRSFPLRQLRDIHIVNHTRERSNPCPHCSKSFFSKYDMQKHLLTHSGDKPFKCTICEKAFTRATLLHRHEKTHTDIPKFICLYCEKPFISQEEMEKHAERHNKNRPFKCNVCNKSFAFKQGLERHLVVHSNDQPFPCHYCTQKFPTSSKLARHLTAHAGQRPFPCKFCPKSFLLSHHLTRHLRSHKSSVCTYECSSCSAVFNTREGLIHHTGEHTRETLICVLCCEELPAVDKVAEHIEAHVASEAHACEFCDMMFMTAERLQEHTDHDHVDDLVPYIEDDAKLLKQNDEKKQNNKEVKTKTGVARRSKPLKKDVAQDELLETTANEEEEDELFQSIKEYLLTEPIGVKKEASEQDDNADKEEEFIEVKNESESPTLKRRRVQVEKKLVVNKLNPTTSNKKQIKETRTRSSNISSKAQTKRSPVRRITLSSKNDKETKVIQEKVTSTRKRSKTEEIVIVDNSEIETTGANLQSTVVKKRETTPNQRGNPQKIDAAALAKAGRLRIKDGQIVLS